MIRNFLRSVIPTCIWNRLGTARRKWVSRDDAQKSTREVFSRIYASGLWGRGEGSSGRGSSDAQIVDPYVDVVTKWAARNDGDQLCAVDLGCGNFCVGARIFPLFEKYIALDIVPDLIKSHSENPAYQSVDFQCVDAITEPVPEGDVIFVRQVMQHLSNDQILQILPKIKKFKNAIITEHLPSPSKFRSKNQDKLHGGSVRVEKGSGVYLEEAPFFISALETVVLLEVPGGSNPEKDGIIQTVHYRFG